MVPALGIILYRSLSLSRKDMVDIHVKTGELILDPLEQTYPTDEMKIVGSIIKIVAKDPPTELFNRLAWLNKQTNTCIQRSNESCTSYIERFV